MDFISESITPVGDALDTTAMSRGEPGVPASFAWRGQTVRVIEELRRWKASSPEGGRAGNEVYLRRHYHLLRMSDGTQWTIYFLRQTPKSGSPRKRWFLYSREPDAPANAL